MMEWLSSVPVPLVWATIGVVLVAAEILAPGFFLAWFAAAAFLTFILTSAVDGLSPVRQVGLFTLLSAASIAAAVAWRRRHPRPPPDAATGINDRAAQQMGAVAALDEPIRGGRGRLLLGDTLWHVEGPDRPAGTTVRVVGHRGMVLRVEPVDGPPGT
jgi:membrane protein implicated in regulation of membrane protease activity